MQMTEPKIIARDASAISEIRPYLHLSGIAPLTPRNLKPFTCIINCVAGLRHIAPSHLTVLHIPIEDDEQTDLSPYWQLVFQTIDEQKRLGGKVLIFCGMGISRSASFVVAYLMCIEKMSLHDAYKHVQQVRNIICPNVGFFKQMIELEEKLYNKSTVKIIEPMPGVEVADVVWNELYDELLEEVHKREKIK
uniref:Protein-tyrosine-phosphatase n=1 Tax=Parascaris univalens TaxID=6257 RepID=A0A915BIG6_PARUN